MKHIKQAERNVINQAKFFTDALEMFSSMHRGMARFSSDHVGGQDIRDGLHKVMLGLYKEQQHAMARCFSIVGVGGEEAAQFSRDRAKQVFGQGMHVIPWLDQWFGAPGSWSADEELAFRKELKDALDKPEASGN